MMSSSLMCVPPKIGEVLVWLTDALVNGCLVETDGPGLLTIDPPRPDLAQEYGAMVPPLPWPKEQIANCLWARGAERHFSKALVLLSEAAAQTNDSVDIIAAMISGRAIGALRYGFFLYVPRTWEWRNLPAAHEPTEFTLKKWPKWWLPPSR